jgi:hypothetical protein
MRPAVPGEVVTTTRRFGRLGAALGLLLVAAGCSDGGRDGREPDVLLRDAIAAMEAAFVDTIEAVASGAEQANRKEIGPGQCGETDMEEGGDGQLTVEFELKAPPGVSRAELQQRVLDHWLDEGYDLDRDSRDNPDDSGVVVVGEGFILVAETFPSTEPLVIAGETACLPGTGVKPEFG